MKKLNREKIRIGDYLDNENSILLSLFDNDNPQFKEIQDVVLDYDADKNSVEHEVIIQRISDGKFFRFIYTQHNFTSNSASEEIAEEVFPKEKTIIYYE